MNNRSLFKNKNIFYAAITAIAVLAAGLAINFAVLTSHAESAGQISAVNSVNIRADASTTSDILATKNGGESIQILGQKTGADGYTWYQIYINATTVGYVRSDFATVTDGSIPDTINADGTTSSIDDSITKVNPVSGSVTGGQAVRVRSDASTSSTIVASAASGQALTVNGTKEGTDERTWYYVEFTSDSSTVKGFIRSDFIELSGDLVELTEDGGDTAAATETDTAAAETTEPVVEEQKDYDTELQDGVWYLLDYNAGQKYSIDSMFEIINAYNASDNTKTKGGTAKTVWLIIFIILTILSLGAAAYAFLKLREANDKAAFADAEKERKARLSGAPKNSAQRSAGQGMQRSAGVPGTQKTTQSSGQRPVQGSANGQRPVNSGSVQRTSGGQRPVQSGTQRPVQSGAQRPAQSGAQRSVQSGAQRPVQSGAQRPVQSGTQRPVQSGVQRPVQSGAQRPVQSGTANVNRSESAENAGAVRNTTPAQNVRPAQNAQTPKNGYDDDDEFEFGFLNWDGDEKK